MVAAGYGGLRSSDLEAPITDADVDRFLKELRQSFAQLRPDRPTVLRPAAVDLATIDYDARVGGPRGRDAAKERRRGP